MGLLSIVYQDGSEVPASDMNAIVGAINALDDRLIVTRTDVDYLLSVDNSFKVVHTGGLSGTVKAGLFKTSTATIISSPETSITFPANATRYVYLSDSGVISQSGTRPTTGMELARLSTNSTTVTQLVDLRTRFTPMSIYATLADIIAATPERLVSARRTVAGSYLPFSTYQTVDNWNIIDKNTGTILNGTTGIIVIPTTDTYRITARLRLISDYTDEPVAAKLSIFAGSSELVVLDEKGTPQGGLVLGGSWEPNDGFSANNQISVKIYLTAGRNVKISGSNTNALELTRKIFR